MSEFTFVLALGDEDGLLGSPIADFNKGGNVSDVVSMVNHHECYFMLLLGARTGSTAAPVCTVLSCDTVSPDNTQAITFEYKLVTSVNTNAAWVSAATYTVVTGDTQAIIFRVRKENLYAGYEYVQLSLTEPADDPQVGALLIMMAKPRYDAAVPPQAIV